MIYTIQATNTGWILYRAAGVTQHFAKLATAKMLVEDCGGRLRIIDAKGNELN